MEFRSVRVCSKYVRVRKRQQHAKALTITIDIAFFLPFPLYLRATVIAVLTMEKICFQIPQIIGTYADRQTDRRLKVMTREIRICSPKLTVQNATISTVRTQTKAARTPLKSSPSFFVFFCA